jgi:hypothetical protein
LEENEGGGNHDGPRNTLRISVTLTKEKIMQVLGLKSKNQMSINTKVKRSATVEEFKENAKSVSPVKLRKKLTHKNMYGNEDIDIVKDHALKAVTKKKIKEEKMFGPSLKEKKKRCRIPIICFENPWRSRWDVAIMVLSIINGIEVPVDIGFHPPIFESSSVNFMNYLIDIIFIIDLLLNFFTSYKNINTGEEIFEPKVIACKYVSSFQFYLDLVSALSIDNIIVFLKNDANLGEKFKPLQLFKFFRLLRLSRLINMMNSSENLKMSMKLLKMCLFLFLYVHCIGCMIYFLAE